MTTLDAILSPAARRQMRRELPVLQIKAEQAKRKAAAAGRYAYDAAAYIREKLGWRPWRGDGKERPGQDEVLDAYVLALRQQHEKAAFEAGEATADELRYWQPGQVIQNWISVDAGHTVGKTKLAAGIVSHFFDNFAPSITYCFAPSALQINDLLFKEIRTDRRERDLPGEVLDTPNIKLKGNHFVRGRATNNAKGSGTERVQGQHGKYLLFIFDEAEGIANFVWDAVESMESGGIVIVIVLRNPRTRSSRAHKIRELPHVATFRISCLWHPNVLQNREVVPGSVKRDWVERMLRYTDVADNHDEDAYTFELPWRPGVIYRPHVEFLWRVLGVASAHQADNTFAPIGRYEAARMREAPLVADDPEFASFGIDVARYGNDHGSFWIRHNGRLWREAKLTKRNNVAYYAAVKEAGERLAAQGVKRLSIRVDGGGGFGGGVVDLINMDASFAALFDEVTVAEVHFNGTPYDAQAYADTVTEMYYHAGEALRVVVIDSPPDELEADLCERPYRYAKKRGVDVKELVSKEKFKDVIGRSPDDGDGFCLAAGPDYIFGSLGGQLVF